MDSCHRSKFSEAILISMGKLLGGSLKSLSYRYTHSSSLPTSKKQNIKLTRPADTATPEVCFHCSNDGILEGDTNHWGICTIFCFYPTYWKQGNKSKDSPLTIVSGRARYMSASHYRGMWSLHKGPKTAVP